MMSANSPVVKRWFKRVLVAVGILAVGWILGSFVVTPPSAETQSAAAITENEDSLQRGIDASAARYTAMAASYAVENDDLQRGIDASAARYTAMAASYTAKEE
jgi:type II secretory pathway component PulM